ncbi:hypothetical protein AMAG_17619 [Allomyces macrogynus ATCC 38327]|uniref:Ubiquitin-like domain-containing protein n=1 Tax=Allomyces macrogynus (strain ATCC 38327) TaxID=578462 RepID=A0A0L0RVH9_ALLM3|nr:hypothetical protein AMAG_17619 [Allomyces macrogynus ATCC 38327]|eukprot:KNE54076.1 hypothetical protein AMAG_17619 [Allomyces macrogynus ATCC 38327]
MIARLPFAIEYTPAERLVLVPTRPPPVPAAAGQGRARRRKRDDEADMDEPLTLLVKKLTGHTVTLRAHPLEMIADVKDRIEE